MNSVQPRERLGLGDGHLRSDRVEFKDSSY